MENYMHRALELAKRGFGSVAPNPMVGCVIVHDDKIIGEGWHKKFGEPHAELNAINTVSNQELLAQSTLYVTLEPCNHFGKTPPCADLIIAKNIPRVVIASVDPNPKVSGRGIDKLKAAGIDVTIGVLDEEAKFLNRRFNTFHQKKRPYIILKWAQSADGFMDKPRAKNETGSIKISSAESHQLAHKWRTEEQAILIGKTTAINDQPLLTARLWPGNNPLRILIDPNLEVNLSNPIFNEHARTLVFNRLESRLIFKTERIQLDFSQNVLDNILAYLHYEGIQSVLVEGGRQTLDSFIESNLFDEIRRFASLELKLAEGLKAPKLEMEAAESSIIENKDLLEVFRKT